MRLQRIQNLESFPQSFPSPGSFWCRENILTFNYLLKWCSLGGLCNAFLHSLAFVETTSALLEKNTFRTAKKFRVVMALQLHRHTLFHDIQLFIYVASFVHFKPSGKKELCSKGWQSMREVRAETERRRGKNLQDFPKRPQNNKSLAKAQTYFIGLGAQIPVFYIFNRLIDYTCTQFRAKSYPIF